MNSLMKVTLATIAQYLLLPLVIIIFIKPVFAENTNSPLKPCIVVSHCVKEDWTYTKTRTKFEEAKEIVLNTPRTKIVEEKNNYFHAEAQTKWMRYTDDLELFLDEDRGLIEVRSESREGIGDMGVNAKRVNLLKEKLDNIS